jgi:hypothetical protein
LQLFWAFDMKNAVAFACAILMMACRRSPRPAPPAETALAIPPTNAAPPPNDPARRTIAEATPDIVAKAADILEAESSAPIGKEVPFELNGRRYVARFEWHDNPDGDPDRPAGKHKGITVYTDD